MAGGGGGRRRGGGTGERGGGSGGGRATTKTTSERGEGTEGAGGDRKQELKSKYYIFICLFCFALFQDGLKMYRGLKILLVW